MKIDTRLNFCYTVGRKNNKKNSKYYKQEEGKRKNMGNDYKNTEIEEVLSAGEKRELRRMRRRKSQMIARISVSIFLILILLLTGVGVYFLVSDSRITESVIKEEAEMEEEVVSEETILSSEEASEEAVPTDEEEFSKEKVLDEVIDSVITEMTLEEKVAGLFIVYPEDITGVDIAVQAKEGTKEALEKYPVGGLLYRGKNMKSKEQFKEMIDNTNAYAKYPLFLAVDEEGGDISPVAKALAFEGADHPSSYGASNDAEAVKSAMNKVGNYLKEVGINLNFAPVADVAGSSEDSLWKNRTYGTDPEAVSSMVYAANEGLRQAGVVSGIKHFPGMGGTKEDTHEKMAVIEKTKEELMEHDLIPFISAIANDAEMIMVGHASYPNIVGDNTPASLSAVMISDLLRNQLGYNGIVITDGLDMAAVTEYYGADEAAVYALRAGADMILLPESFKDAYEGVLKAVEEGTISEERIDHALKRIFRVKYRDSVGE